MGSISARDATRIEKRRRRGIRRGRKAAEEGVVVLISYYSYLSLLELVEIVAEEADSDVSSNMDSTTSSSSSSSSSSPSSAAVSSTNESEASFASSSSSSSSPQTTSSSSILSSPPPVKIIKAPSSSSHPQQLATPQQILALSPFSSSASSASTPSSSSSPSSSSGPLFHLFEQASDSAPWRSLTDDGGVLLLPIASKKRKAEEGIKRAAEEDLPAGEEEEEDEASGECCPILSRVYLNARSWNKRGEIISVVSSREEDEEEDEEERVRSQSSSSSFSSSSPAPSSAHDHWSDNEIDVILGQACLPKGVEIALCSSRIGDEFFLRLKASSSSSSSSSSSTTIEDDLDDNPSSSSSSSTSYGWSSTRRPSSLAEEEDLYWQVKVVHWEKEKNLHTMNAEEKLQFAERRRRRGRRLFARGAFRSAYKQYQRALTVLEALGPSSSSSSSSAEQQSIAQSVLKSQAPNDFASSAHLHLRDDLLTIMLMNCATCKHKLNDSVAALSFCNQILTRAPLHQKALFRRAELLLKRGDLEEAQVDYKKLLEINEELKLNAPSSFSPSSSSSSSASSSAQETDYIPPSLITKIKHQLAVIANLQKKNRVAEQRKWNGFLLKEEEQPNLHSSSSPVKTKRAPVTLYDDVISEREEEELLSSSCWHRTVKQVKELSANFVQEIRKWCNLNQIYKLD